MKNSLDEKEERKKTRQEEVRDAVQRRMMEGLNAALEQEYRFIRLTPSMGMGKTYTVARFMKETHDRDKDMRFFYFAPNISTRNAMKKELMDAGAGEDDILVVESEDDCLKKNIKRLNDILVPVFRMDPKKSGKKGEDEMIRQKDRLDERINDYMEAESNVERMKGFLKNDGSKESREMKKKAEAERDGKGRLVMDTAKKIIRISKKGEKGMSPKDRSTLSALFPKLLMKERTYILATHKMIDFPSSVTGSDEFWQTFSDNDVLIIDEADRIKDTMWETQLDRTANPIDCYEFIRTVSERLNGIYDGERSGTFAINRDYGDSAEETCRKMKDIADSCLNWLNGGKPAANRKLEDEDLNASNIVTFGSRTKMVNDHLWVKREEDRLSITSEKTGISVRSMEMRLTADTRKLLYYIRKLSTSLYEHIRERDVTFSYKDAIENVLEVEFRLPEDMRKAVAGSIYRYSRKGKDGKELALDIDDSYRKGGVLTMASDRSRSVTSSSFRTYMFTSTPNYRIRSAVESTRMTAFVSSTVNGTSVKNIDFRYMNRMFSMTGKGEYLITYDDIKPYKDERDIIEEIDVQADDRIRERIEMLSDPDKEDLEDLLDDKGEYDSHKLFLIAFISFIDMMKKYGKKSGLFFIPAFPEEKDEKDKDPWWNKDLIERIISTYGNDIEYRAVRAEDLRERGREFHKSKDMIVVITTGQSAGVGENLTVVKEGEECDFDSVFVNMDSYVDAIVDAPGKATDEERMKQKKKVFSQYFDLYVLEGMRHEFIDCASRKMTRKTGWNPLDKDFEGDNPLNVQQTVNALQKMGRITRRAGGPPKLVCYDSRLRTQCHASKLMFPNTEFMGCAGAFLEYIEKKEDECRPEKTKQKIGEITRRNRREDRDFMRMLHTAREECRPEAYDNIREDTWQMLIPDGRFSRPVAAKTMFSVSDDDPVLFFMQRDNIYSVNETHGTPLIETGRKKTSVPAAEKAFRMKEMNAAYASETGIHLVPDRLLEARMMFLPKYVEVVKGEIGEKIFQKLCEVNGIALDPLPRKLKEEADFVVRGTDVYIDVKNHRGEIRPDPHILKKKLSGVLVIVNVSPKDDGEVFTAERAIENRNDLQLCIIRRVGSAFRTEENISEAMAVLKDVIRRREKEKEKRNNEDENEN